MRSRGVWGGDLGSVSVHERYGQRDYKEELTLVGRTTPSGRIIGDSVV
jgi:hypothetical protein